MGEIYFPIAAVASLLIISLTVTLAPATVEDLSQGSINTTQLQDSTNVTGTNPDANATAGTGAIDQAGQLVTVLTNPESGNRLLAGFFTLIVAGLIAWIVVAVWIG